MSGAKKTMYRVFICQGNDVQMAFFYMKNIKNAKKGFFCLCHMVDFFYNVCIKRKEVGRMARFLRFLTFLSMVFFASNVLAAGYVCDSVMTYTSCNTGYTLVDGDCVVAAETSCSANYYLDNGTCKACTTLSNTTTTTATQSIANGTRTTTTRCNGTYTTAPAGNTGGSSSCTGCSSATYTYSCSCDDGYISLNNTLGQCYCTTDNGDVDPLDTSYSCSALKKYSSCNDGYFYLGGACNPCATLANRNLLSSVASQPVETETTITGGKRIKTTTTYNEVRCNGTYTGGAGGTNGAAYCTGCTEEKESTRTEEEYTCSCNSGYEVTGQGTSACGCLVLPDVGDSPYVCETDRHYYSCNAGYYLSANATGNACLACSDVDNTAEIDRETTTEISDFAFSDGSGTRTTRTPVTTITKCVGQYETGPANNTTVGSSACTGCSETSITTQRGTPTYTCTCNSGYTVSGQGSASCMCISTEVGEGGYSCPTDKKYTSCAAGQYLSSADVGNACLSCADVDNTDVQSSTTTSSDSVANITGGTRTTTTTTMTAVVCNGKYTGGPADNTTVGADSCTGCSSTKTETQVIGTAYTCACNDGYYVVDQGLESCSCAAADTAGYVCDSSTKEYEYCNEGYYLTGTGLGNSCLACSSLSNTSEISRTEIQVGEALEETITGGMRYTQTFAEEVETCAGQYTGTGSITGMHASGSEACTGCSNTVKTTENENEIVSCVCNSGYVVKNSSDGTTCTCELDTGGYTCETEDMYTSCNPNFYMAAGTTSGTTVTEALAYRQPISTPAYGNACLPCPTGYTCAGGTAAPQKAATVVNGTNYYCEPGQYYKAATYQNGWAIAEGGCTTCAAGSFCTGVTETFTYLSNATKGTQTCASQFVTGDVCNAETGGTCIAFANSDAGAKSWGECYTTVTGGKSVKKKSDDTFYTQSCGMGKLTTFGSSSKVVAGDSATYPVCTECACGYACTGTENWNCANASGSCTDNGIVGCAKGSYSVDANNPTRTDGRGGTYCKPADPGYYVKEAYQCKQDVCLAGSKCPGEGTIMPTLCDPGTYQDATGQTTCKDSGKGYYVSTAGAVARTECGEGHYCPNEQNTTQSQCNEGTYQDAKAQSACKDSGQGYYVPTKGATARTECACGNICPGSVNVAQEQCKAGTYSDVKASVCISAPAGSYVPSAGACPADVKKCAIGSTTAQVDENGVIAEDEDGNIVSITGASSCVACPIGETTAAMGSATCGVLCPNTYPAGTDLDSVTGDTKKMTKWWREDVTWNSDNTVSNLCVARQCGQNYYLNDPDATVENDERCELCSSFANGLYPYSSGSKANDTPEACFVRKGELPGQMIANPYDTEPTDCPADDKNATYNPGLTGEDLMNSQAIHYGETSTCDTCPTDTYVTGPGSEQCIPCLENYHSFGVKFGETSCRISCPAGSYLASAYDTECTEVGSKHWAAASYVTQGNVGTRNACPTNPQLWTVGYGVGADEANDCGHILHVGDRKLYLRQDKKTTPSLNVKVGGTTFYGNMRQGDVYMSDGVESYLRLNYNNTKYSVYDDSGENYVGDTGVSLTLSAATAASSKTPASYNDGNGLDWSAVVDGTTLTGVGGCSATTSTNGTVAAAGFTPEGTGTGCYCKITDPVEGARWVYASNHDSCSTKCGYLCANNMTGTSAKNITYRTNLYQAAGITVQ